MSKGPISRAPTPKELAEIKREHRTEMLDWLKRTGAYDITKQMFDEIVFKMKQEETEIEVHPDGAKEVKREACRFCKPGPPCTNEWCPTNQEE